MIKELPRVLTIYDIDIPMKEAKASIAHHFRKHSHLKDGRYFFVSYYFNLKSYEFRNIQSCWNFTCKRIYGIRRNFNAMEAKISLDENI